MISLVVRYEVGEDDGDRVGEALRRMGEQVRAHEPGCLRWQVSRSRENPRVFHLYEVYRDEAALKAHRETPHFQQIVLGEVRPLVRNREADTCDVVVE